MQIEFAKDKSYIDAQMGLQHTRYGSGPFHPAIRNGSITYYWPNITYENEDDAAAWAKKTVDQAYAPVNAIIQGWNIYPV